MAQGKLVYKQVSVTDATAITAIAGVVTAMNTIQSTNALYPDDKFWPSPIGVVFNVTAATYTAWATVTYISNAV